MGVWKKLNTETNTYEVIPNTDSDFNTLTLKDTVGILDAYTSHSIADVAITTSTNNWATLYTLEGLIIGDVIKTKRQYNGQNRIITDSEGNDLTSKISWSNYIYGTFVLDENYKSIVVACETGYENYAHVLLRDSHMKKLPSFNDEFIPTLNDNEDTVLKTLSSSKIFDIFGGSNIRLKENLNGKTIIFMGDSYTKGASSQFSSLCEKYGAIADNRGIVSSSICGDTTGSKGYQPMWSRTVNVCDEYTQAGTTENVGAIVFMGGANDGFGKNTWLGSGTNDKDTSHIYGALHKIFKTFRDTFNCPIFVILQPYFPNGSVPDTNATEETATTLGFDSLEQYLTFDTHEYCAYSMQKKQNVVKEMAEFYNCIITDCCFNWHSIFNATDLAKYWGSDGHPTGTGYQSIANYLENTMLMYKW